MTNIIIKLKEFREEREIWKHLLGILSQENVSLKTGLSELLIRQPVKSAFLEVAEHYQNIFLQKDQIISLIRKDIAELDDQSVSSKCKDENALQEVMFKQKKLQKELTILESSFINMKNQFTNIELFFSSSEFLIDHRSKFPHVEDSN
jgi:hypothetical protein